MKKKYFFTTAFMMFSAIAISAQTTIIDRPPNGIYYVTSTKGTDGSIFVAADSFVLTEEIAIGEIDVSGGLIGSIGYLGSLEIGVNVYIYADDNGVPAGNPTLPGTGILELSDIPPVYYSKHENGAPILNRTDFNNIKITDANDGEQVILQPGTYWISFFLTIEGNVSSIGQWGWIGSTEPYPLPPFPAVMIDPFNTQGYGWTNWITISEVTNWPLACAWTMRSEKILSTKENELSKVKIYPNPSADIVNVSIPENIKVYESGLFDMTGKMINNIHLIDNTLNISFLPKGIYMLKIETSKGVLTRKIVRK